MSYFNDGIIYIIVPVDDVTEHMINNSKMFFNTEYETMRESNDNRVLFKIKAPVHEAFDGYEWFNKISIKEEMKKPEWIVELPGG